MRKKNKLKHKKDFGWRPKKCNPYAKEQGTDWPWRLKLGVIIVSLLAMLLLALYHPFFHIQKFNITGLQRINNIELQNVLEGMLSYKKFFVLPAKSYLLVDSDEVQKIIESRFPVESVIIKKSFPQTLDVIIEEKISTIIYDNGKQYSYLGPDGNIVEILRNIGDDEWQEVTKTVSTTLEDGTVEEHEEVVERYHIPPIKNIILEMGDYPIVYDMRAKEGIINDVMLKQEIVQGVFQWFNMLDKRTDIPFGHVLLENELGDVVIKTREGWEISVNLLERIDQQFEDLQYVLREKVTRPNLNYIDLRYKDRVYWQ